MSVEIQDRIRAIIAEQLSQDPEEVVPEASFVDDLGADSLDLGGTGHAHGRRIRCGDSR